MKSRYSRSASMISVAPVYEEIGNLAKQALLLRIREDRERLLRHDCPLDCRGPDLVDDACTLEPGDQVVDLGAREFPLVRGEVKPLLPCRDRDQGLFPFPDIRRA